jgi:hypothetical protein
MKSVRCSHLAFRPTRRPSAVLVAALLLGAAMLVTSPSHAQRWLVDGIAGLGTGLEGGDSSGDGVEWQRARTRIVAGFDLAIDESVYQAWGFRAFVELERRTDFGLELRYQRWISDTVGAHVELVGVIAPETLFGGGIGATVLFPLDDDIDLYLEPKVDALPLGSDLPGDSVLIWLLLNAGVRFDL